MRLLSSLFSVTLLVAGALGAKKAPSATKFDNYHAKALSSSPLKLSETSYKSLTTAPRDYTIAVLLTALDPRFGCQLCREFQPEYDLLAKSWAKGDKLGQSRMLYSVLDFADGRDIFVSLGLQTAPVLLIFQPTEGPHATASHDPVRYDFTTGPPTAEQVHGWLARHLPNRPHPPVKRPVNWMRWGVTFAAFLGTGTAALMAWPYVLPIVQNRNIWASGTLIAILLFTSGHMFNTIRKTPYVTGDGRGGVSYFAGNFQNQNGFETQVVAALYGVMSVCAIFFAIKIPRMSDPRKQQAAVLACGGTLFVLYSFLLSIFRIKNGGYPFSLPPFM